MENIRNLQTDISIVIPVYNEEESLPELKQAIVQALENKYSFEIIFVDDGSQDLSWQQVQRLSDDDERVRGLALSHNYGKSVALQAGFEIADVIYIVTMDADLQDDPREVP